MRHANKPGMPPATAPIPLRPARAFDVLQRYVRLRETRADGFVLFDFAIGDPDLSVELMLPQAAFNAFCRQQQVRWIDAEEGAALDRERQRWSQGHPSDQQQETP